MILYSILIILFCIGGIGVYIASQKTKSASEKKKQWIKFVSYLILVFAQIFMISAHLYLWFASAIVIGGFYEITAVGKSRKILISGLILYSFFAFDYWHFFYSADLKWQQFLFITVITFDGYSQVSGQLFGRTKVFPETSPNKTFEGLAGGFISVIITSIILSRVLEIETIQGLTCALFIGIFSVGGDFLASFYKRRKKVKDFSKLIPGHGGILDRFDSLIVAACGFFLMQLIPFSNVEIWNCSTYILVFLMLFFLAEIGYGTFKLKVEITRKFVHIFSGFVCLTFPIFLKEWTSVFGLCLSFILLLIVSKTCHLLPSINAIGRKSYGSVLFPISIFICFLIQKGNHDLIQFYIPILILAFCDPLAALSGKKWPYGKYKVGNDYKTVVGSAAFFISCFLILMLLLYFSESAFSRNPIFNCFFISVLATITEALGKNGFDNLTIPLSVLSAIFLINL